MIPPNPSVPDRKQLATLLQRPGFEDELTFTVANPVSHVGQGKQNDIVLDDDTVSTQHARLEFVTTGWRITDLNSRNGTYIDGVRLAPGTPTPLPDNSLVAFGAAALTFRNTADTQAAEAVTGLHAQREALTPSKPVRFRLPVWVLLVLIVVAVILVLLLSGSAFASELSSIVRQPATLPIPERPWVDVVLSIGGQVVA